MHRRSANQVSGDTGRYNTATPSAKLVVAAIRDAKPSREHSLLAGVKRWGADFGTRCARARASN